MSKVLRSRSFLAAASLAAAVAVPLASASPAAASHVPPRGKLPPHTGWPAPPPTSPVVTVVASGLNSPKHLIFGPGGLYVAESGTGGPAGGPTCVSAPGTTGASTIYCEGQTGSVALVSPFGTKTVLSGLPSVIEEDIQQAIGPSAVTFYGGRLAVLFQDELVNANGSNALAGQAGSVFGKLELTRPFSGNSALAPIANVSAFAAANPQNAATFGGTPGETVYDSDPYDIVAYRGGYAIADAAANSVLWLSPKGNLSLVARLPTVAEPFAGGTVNAQAVPTSIAVGPDGALYVGTLRGVPSAPGTADVYRVMPGQAPVVFASGLSAVTAIAFDQGQLLALEYNTGGLTAPPTTPGALVEISRSGSLTTLPITGLYSPTGLAVGPDGAVYVSNYGTSAGNASPSGEVLKITHLL